MEYQIHKKFLSVDLFEKVQSLIMDGEFPWRRKDHMVTNTNDTIYFCYHFYNAMQSLSEFYQPYIIPILKKLRATAPIQVRANMFISALFEASTWHRDSDFQCKSAILYLNDCDGGTELKINNKIISIKADANKILVFDSQILHRPITSKKEPLRYIINFNYFTNDYIEKG